MCFDLLIFLSLKCYIVIYAVYIFLACIRMTSLIPFCCFIQGSAFVNQKHQALNGVHLQKSQFFLIAKWVWQCYLFICAYNCYWSMCMCESLDNNYPPKLIYILINRHIFWMNFTLNFYKCWDKRVFLQDLYLFDIVIVNSIILIKK